jgi:hypothetical protein
MGALFAAVTVKEEYDDYQDPDTMIKRQHNEYHISYGGMDVQ